MERLYPQLILDALKNVRYPASGKNIVEAGMVEDDIRIDGNKVSFSLIFDRPTDPFIKSLVRACEAAIETYISPEVEVKGNIAVKTRQEAPQPAVKPLAQVKNIIGVSSGKGGVGKSTVASNLAVALAREGYKVGLLDADIFGPSMPKMFGVEDEELYMHHVDGRELIIPIERYGVKLLSIGFLVDKNDMPPGTSDIHLTLVQTLALTGVVIVSTPQQVALADARKGIAMFTGDKVNVPILGLVENMAWFTPAQHPDERYYIFGKEGGVELAKELGVKLLAQIPLVADVCDDGDAGTPIALKDTLMGHEFLHLAHEVVDAVDERNKTLPPTTKVNVTKK